MKKEKKLVPSKFKKAYESYKSVWETKESWRIRDEIWMVHTWSHHFDKWRTSEELTSEFRLMALREILEKQGSRTSAKSLS